MAFSHPLMSRRRPVTPWSRPLMLAAALFAATAAGPSPAATPTAAALDAEVRRAMLATGAKGLAIATIEDGQVAQVRSYGLRNAAGAPLETDTPSCTARRSPRPHSRTW